LKEEEEQAGKWEQREKESGNGEIWEVENKVVQEQKREWENRNA